ncbi:hypothetical protein CC86DRAFT_350866 [Ophiobolus disseminans]|uniref:P-loop containing nucleoside triphosphate hydrolase protein n=1 Tax=Ophiobolus disseminans TaxID=1469910 RepID=A0A6A6ZYZ5_9PLEO|nr:hypothetical protein CC86DRAFT_350866 [Ophiobolus disseminans]
MDWDDFEARAREAVPSQELKAKRCWIGVLSHEKTPDAVLHEMDFVWMIGHNKISIQKIHDTYQKRNEGLDFQLEHKDKVVDRNDTIKEFLAPNGVLVLFLARRSDEHQPLALPAARRTSEVTGRATTDAATQAHAAPPRTSPIADRVKDEPTGGMSRSMTPVSPHNKPVIAQPRDAPHPGEVATLRRQSFTENQKRILGLLGNPSTLPHSANTPPTAVVTSEMQPASERMNNRRPSIAEPQHRSSLAALPIPPSPQNDVLDASNVTIKAERRSLPVFHHMEEETQVSFDPENFFNRELSPEQDSQELAKPTDRSIRDIIDQQDPIMLEAGVKQSIKVLQRLQSSFSRYAGNNQDAFAWNEAIETLIPQSQRKRTIVGVVGNTGAGKSSVINAMLDEERLVPTNCMRACTAVVTEMSWNASTDWSSKYRAEIEFITREDWEKELKMLLREFLTDTGGISRDVSDQSSDAGIAWAKFHSVYPKRTRDSLSDCTIESLMTESEVLAVLGTTKKINTASPNAFYKRLQGYVDSKEKVSKKDKAKDKDKQKKAFEMEYWPLIKVVKIYVKAQALSTGAVIVDLPGVHDSNAARAAVAQGYMKQCTGLWIVAPINRAVDDKAAKTLLGESFKRQLKYDGGFSSVTFICSKTDDISITEAIDSLELEDEVEGLYEQERQYQREIDNANEKIEDLKEAKQVYKLAQTEAVKDIEVWENLEERLQEGETVFAPKPKSNKRKRVQAKDARKRHQKGRTDFDDDGFIVSDEEDSSAESESGSDDEDKQAPGMPLTEDDIKVKIKELRESKKLARREALEYTRKIEELQPQDNELIDKIAAIKAEISHICIAGRNDYSKRAIQQDFAAGIKELDQENAAEEDEENFNPDEELRDYEEVAKSLPVFCVSSRAYQQMCGRLKKDDSVPGFKSPEETEMPQLQAHCKKLTEAGRVQTARTFLLSVCQQLTTFSLWASNDGTGLRMTDNDKHEQFRYLEKRLSELERGLEEAVRSCLNVMKKEMNGQIFNKYPDLINEAIEAAPDTAQKWGAHKSDGGLTWMTYKAIVRREGVYQSPAAGLRDFNADLVNPIVKKLATGWERAFQNRLPKAFDAFVKDSGRLLNNFHTAVEERARNNGVGLASLGALKNQICTYEQLFNDLNQILVTKMTELQREANRDFTPTIANIMHTVYDICANESGSGCYMRMKAHMSQQVDQNRHIMFHDATKTVKQHLDAMCKELEDVMDGRADEIYVKMKADYMRVLGGVQINETAVMPKEERALRADIMDILRSVDAQFEPIARGNFEQQEIAEQEIVDEHVTVEDDDNAFESAHESAQHGDSVTEDVDDTLITEPTPSKPGDGGSDKENRGLPTPSDDGMDEAL